MFNIKRTKEEQDKLKSQVNYGSKITSMNPFEDHEGDPEEDIFNPLDSVEELFDNSEDDEENEIPCTDCDGTGEISEMGENSECPTCGGTGTMFDDGDTTGELTNLDED